jgi:hypothetical protein
MNPVEVTMNALAGFCLECRFFYRSAVGEHDPLCVSHGLCDACADKPIEFDARKWGRHQTHDRRAVQSSDGSAARIA